VQGIGSRIRGLQVRQRGRGKRIGDREERLRVRGGARGSEVRSTLGNEGRWVQRVQVLLSSLARLCLE